MMGDAYLIGGCRTPVGRFLGGLASIPSPDLGAIAIADVLRRAELDASRVDEVILGCILSAGLGQAPARQAALRAGLPDTVAAVTINKMCGSGLKAVMLAAQAIRCGDARCIVAGGMENMSRAPHLLPNSREGWKFGHQQVVDSMIHDGLWCAFEDISMGAEADYIAESRSIRREDQDAYSVESHRRAVAAQSAQALAAELVPVTVKGRGERLVAADEGPRVDTNLASLAKLKPAFGERGTVTAGNASQLSDGAAAVLVADDALAREHRSALTARIVAYATSGVAPKDVFIAPISAIEQVLHKARLKIDDIDLIELNEAFAAQCLACMRPLNLPHERTNVLGGAIALGHPIGASGARILVTLMHALAARHLRRGLCALCLGGGNAVAMIIERERD